MFTIVLRLLVSDATTAFRDAWIALLKAAHWHCDTEQLVRTGDATHHRADITAAGPDGTLWALDVAVTATPGPHDTIHQHLERTASAKATRYTPGGARHLPDGHTLVPLIFSADHPWMNLEALQFLHKVLNQACAVTAPPTVGEWQPHVASLQQNHLAKLSHALHLSNWQMHAACGTLL